MTIDDVNRWMARCEVCGPYFHPDDPAGWLGPGGALIVDGLDWAWAFVEYREVPGYPAYATGTNGRLWSRSGNQHRPLLDRWTVVEGSLHDGYLRVTLGFGATKRKIFIHDIVLGTFVGPCPAGMECRHLNGKRTDNRLVNLRWGTGLENAADACRHGTRARGSRSGSAKLTEEIVVEIRRRIVSGEDYVTIAADYGIDSSQLSRIVRGETWAHVPVEDEQLRHFSRNLRIGSLNRAAKLTDDEVIEIRRLAALGFQNKKLAHDFNVASSTISRIVSREDWKHL